MDSAGSNLVVLLTDFGTGDPWVASMKGAVYSINPAAATIDLSHSISPHEIFDGAFTLFRSYIDFPVGTVFLCVVDPGVGSGRRALIVRTDKYFFVAPDNGLLSFIYAHDYINIKSITNCVVKNNI